MFTRSKSRTRVRLAGSAADVEAVQRLRHRCFILGGAADRSGPRAQGRDADAFDNICVHVMVEDRRSTDLIACCRLLPLLSGAEIARSYSAQFYELSALAEYPGPMVEMGRFCIDPAHRDDPTVFRSAWGAVTRFVEDRGVQMLFGCSSFPGIEPDEYEEAFALLADRHLAPGRWLPRVKAPTVFRFAERLRRTKPETRPGRVKMPTLLRGYLGMGGWVSDHAVIDRDLGTLHVFTALEVGTIPPARRRSLSALAG